MKSLVRIEILIDSAHCAALESILRRISIRRTILLNTVEAKGFDADLRREGYADLLGTSLLIAYANPEIFESAKPELLQFLKKCGGAAFQSSVECVN